MPINRQGLELLKEFEGVRLKAYRCPAGVMTIGYGHTKGVKRGDVISQHEAERLLMEDLPKYEAGVTRHVDVELNSNQLSALISFVYNVGEGNFKKSTLLKKLNKEDYEGAANEFRKWNRGGGRVLKGLVRRRAAEKELFND